jgi:hypothetical protein
MAEGDPERLGHLVIRDQRRRLLPQVVDEGREDHAPVVRATESDEDVGERAEPVGISHGNSDLFQRLALRGGTGMGIGGVPPAAG